MSDTISRQAAIDALEKSKEIYFDRQVIIDLMKDIVRNLPSAQPKSYREGYQAGFKDAQPDRKRGKWIAVTEDGDVYKRICSCCGQEAFFQNDDPDELYDGGRYELSDFCPHCGADMREVSE